MHQEIISPSVQLLESMRSVGYSFDAAIADLVDNSISAAAKLVTVDVDASDGEYVAILDDGRGMSAETAREALRLAGNHPDRSRDDLGRFGLGLKTASLSQARCLTVATKSHASTSVLRWDIDYVRDRGDWALLVLDPNEYTNLPMMDRLVQQETGTLVVWNRLDQLLGDASDRQAHLLAHLTELRASLSLTFHRYLASPTELRLRVNGVDLRPTDPFLTSNPRTQRTDVERVHVADNVVEVTAYTLPHTSGLSAAERRRQDLSEGMRQSQGLYVYRNRRLISHGHWYGLARNTELSKQTRIQVDVPSALDDLWQLDIKKSRAEAPQSFRQHLRRIIDPILERGRQIHRFRGRRSTTTTIDHLWTKNAGRDGVLYSINLENPMIRSVLSSLDDPSVKSVSRMLAVIASNFPVLDAYQELAANTRSAQTETSIEDITIQLREIRDAGLIGNDHDVVAQVLRHSEPFTEVQDFDQLVKRVWESK